MHDDYRPDQPQDLNPRASLIMNYTKILAPWSRGLRSSGLKSY